MMQGNRFGAFAACKVAACERRSDCATSGQIIPWAEHTASAHGSGTQRATDCARKSCVRPRCASDVFR